MWNKFNTSFSSVVVILAFCIAMIFSSNTADAQSLWKINSNNPGGTNSGTTAPQDNGNSVTPIYVLMGAVLLGYVLYKVAFQDNSDIEDTTGSDSSASLLIPKHSKLVMKISNGEKIQNTPPVNLYLGIRRDNYNSPIEEKTYLVGVSVNF